MTVEFGDATGRSIGPDIFNSWLLDTGANTILAFKTAIDASGHLAFTTVGGASPANDVTVSGTLATELGLSTAVAANGATNTGTAALASSLLPSGVSQRTQKMWLTGNDDTTIALFDPSGNQLASTTLRTIMTSTNYTDAAGAATSLDISDTATTLGVKMTDVAAKVQSWMRQQSYQGNLLGSASASISSSLIFRPVAYSF